MPTVWFFVVVGGPILLLLVLLFARYSNRKNETRASELRAETGAEQLRDKIEHDRETYEDRPGS